MKKIICILLIVIMGIVGCGKKEKISVVTNKIQENMEDKKYLHHINWKSRLIVTH